MSELDASTQDLIEEAKREGITPGTIDITGYYKFTFTITFTSKNGNKYVLTCGGDGGDIYRFDPYGGWDEWEGAIVRTFSRA